MPHRAALIVGPLADSLSTRGIIATVIVAAALVAASAAVARLTPASTDVFRSRVVSRECDEHCLVTLKTHVSELHPLSRFVRVRVTIPRPEDNATRRPLMLPFSIASTVVFFMDVRLGDELVRFNQSYTRDVTWAAGAMAAHLTVFQLTPVLVSDLDVTVRIENPFSAFFAAGADGLSPNATFGIPVTVGSAEYSRFELTWRTVYCATALVTFLSYSYGVRCGFGLRTAPQREAASGAPQQLSRGRPTPEQLWIWVLCALLVAFNNPFYVYQVRPAFACLQGADPTRSCHEWIFLGVSMGRLYALWPPFPAPLS